MCCPEALPHKPEQMVWVSQAGWSAARWWGVAPTTPQPLPVSWVSAPGGQGRSLGGCWQVCSPDDISSHYWSFYSCSCGPAYSGELGLALCARAWVCSNTGWGIGEAKRGGARGLRWQTNNRPLGLTGDDWCVQLGNLGWPECHYTAVPASDILHLWPCLSLRNIWRTGTDLVLCGPFAARWPSLEWLGPSLEWLGPELDNDGLIVITQGTQAKGKMAPCSTRILF